MNHFAEKVLKYRASSTPDGRKTKKPIVSKMPCAMTRRWNGKSVVDDAATVLPVVPLKSFDRSKFAAMDSKCICRVALGDDDPGLMDPKAQIVGTVTVLSDYIVI